MPHSVVDYFDVGPGYGLVKLSTAAIAGSTIDEIDLRGRFQVTPIFLRRGDKIILNPQGSERLGTTDELIVAGPDENLAKMRI